MQVTYSASSQPQKLTLQGREITQVDKVKLLGLHISEDLKWDTHINKMVTRASQRLRFITTSKKAGMPDTQILKVYTSRVRPILEYACQAWAPGITQGHINDIEHVQRRALRIIWPHLSYQDCLHIHKIDSLQERRQKLCRDLYQKMKDPSHPLNHLLPPVRVNTYNVRNFKDRIVQTRTKRAMGSFVHYAVQEYE